MPLPLPKEIEIVAPTLRRPPPTIMSLTLYALASEGVILI